MPGLKLLNVAKGPVVYIWYHVKILPFQDDEEDRTSIRLLIPYVNEWQLEKYYRLNAENVYGRNGQAISIHVRGEICLFSDFNNYFLRLMQHADVIKWKHSLRYWRGVFTGHRWSTLTKASDLCCFLWFSPEQTVEYTVETPVMWDAIALIITSQ